MSHPNELSASGDPLRLPFRAHLPEIQQIRVPLRLLQVRSGRACAAEFVPFECGPSIEQDRVRC